MKTINVGLVGITGYAGMELTRLLVSHPSMRLAMACSRAESGKRLGDFYPFLNHMPGADVVISVFDPKEAARQCDVVFLAVPAGTAMDMAELLLREGVKVVDLSADFRLRDPETYATWYKREHVCCDLLHKAVYGLPELYAAEISKAKLIANGDKWERAIAANLAADAPYR